MEASVKVFLGALCDAMNEGEAMRLELTKKGDSMNVALIPKLSDDETKVPDEAKKVRTALAMPLVMNNMSLDELGAEFASRVTGFGEARSHANEAYDELLATLKDATANAKNGTAKASKGKDDKDKGDGKSGAKSGEKPAAKPDATKEPPAAQAETAESAPNEEKPTEPAASEDGAKAPTQAGGGSVLDF